VKNKNEIIISPLRTGRDVTKEKVIEKLKEYEKFLSSCLK